MWALCGSRWTSSPGSRGDGAAGGNAFSRIVPGGAAAGGAMQFDMLRQAGIGTTWAATGVTAVP